MRAAAPWNQWQRHDAEQRDISPDTSENAMLMAITASDRNEGRRGTMARMTVTSTSAISANRAVWKSGDMYSCVLSTR